MRQADTGSLNDTAMVPWLKINDEVAAGTRWELNSYLFCFQWYVVCSLGVPYVSLVFVSMAILQAIAGFTLNLLMQHVPRTLVIGKNFHLGHENSENWLLPL